MSFVICVFVDAIWVGFVWGHLQIKLLWMSMDKANILGKHLRVRCLGHSVWEYMVGYFNHSCLKTLIFFIFEINFLKN